jgi:alpha-amylase
MRQIVQQLTGLLIGFVVGGFLSIVPVLGQVNGVADGIPSPSQRNVVVQLFNWKFSDITSEMSTLKQLGYSHIHVSPPEKSIDKAHGWWERYQPVDFTMIEGPLGNEAQFAVMTDTAHAEGMQIIIDVVFNHTIDLDASSDGKAAVSGSRVTTYKLPIFNPNNFHDRCDTSSGDAEKCWLSNELMDLKTETDDVRQVAKNYLAKLVALGADGFRFDAAKNIEQGFFPEVLKAAPGKYAFGEFIASDVGSFGSRPNDMDYYDFPLLTTMRGAFAFGGDLGILTHLTGQQALEGTKAVTLVRNHDIAVGQVDPKHGLHDDSLGIGWDGAAKQLNHTDVVLAYAFILGREEGLPYVFVGMKGASPATDPDNDPDIVAAIRFHNLCLAGEGGVTRRPDSWFVDSPNAIGWLRGNDRFAIINKAAASFSVMLPRELQPGNYEDVRTGRTIQVQQGGPTQSLQVDPRSAVMFVKV